MLFLADESCDALIVRTLRTLGYDVIYIAEVIPSEADENILDWANRDKRILITEDRDFCELVFRDKKPTYGVVLVRIPAPHREKKQVQIEMIVKDHLEELSNAMTTIKPNSFKIRPLPF